MAEHQRTILIRQFIIEHVEAHPTDISRMVSEQFGISSQAARNHLNALKDMEVLRAKGKTRARVWEPVILARLDLDLPLRALNEDVPWRDEVKPCLKDGPPNMIDVCGIAFTEMLNNAIDHSESESARIQMTYTAASVHIKIRDYGVGIFQKIKNEIGLVDEREAILEVLKGKLTTSPTFHSGYGICCTSRMVDIFTMSAGCLLFTHIRPDDDWLMEVDREPIKGTNVEFTISSFNEITPGEVYDQFASAEPGNQNFSRTHVPIRLAQYGSGSLISRSQAKRVLSRFEKFDEVLLDFQGVDFIGQAFADEIFRVFRLTHPKVEIGFRNANEPVRKMIAFATRNLEIDGKSTDNRQLPLFDDEQSG